MLRGMFLRDALGERAKGSRVSSDPAGETGFFISFFALCVKLTDCMSSEASVSGGFWYLNEYIPECLLCWWY
jgi:hypothetical protein